jgi:DNA-binding transcriptional LysR family regulator
VQELQRRTLLLREPGSGTRSTAEELLDELGTSPPILTVGSNGAIRESVQVGLGITLISRDAVARELEDGVLQELRIPTFPRHRAWHLVARASEDLPSSAALFVEHLTRVAGGDGFTLVTAGARG